MKDEALTPATLMFDPNIRKKFLDEQVKAGLMTREEADTLHSDIEDLFSFENDPS